ncbi:MAG: SARP family transcriptional regulator, partial [Eggerthellaceae bacterium]|nr:SARP family transcriptional regulator [Eggerthellaceae bacterium]
MQKSGFISKAACRGYRPRRLASFNVRQRTRLITRLARDRLVARFVVAPTGYGKTCLAIDYAETMFSWAHVFWINAKSPCFIRDLDDGDIAGECMAADPDVKLVVIEDVPQLDAQRVQQLSREIDALLAHDCEVLVTCVPSCDLAGGLQLDRFRMGAGELLLDDDEIDAARSDEERVRLRSSQIPASHRVPALMWDQMPDAPARFVAAAIREDIPSDLLLVTATVFMLHRGSFEDVARMGPVDRLIAADVLADYPHLGFDFEESCFEAPLLDAEIVAQSLKGELDVLVERS